MKIFTTKTELSLQDIATICLRHDTAKLRELRLKRYYRGEHDILRKRQRANNAPNNKIVSNYCAYIADMSTGFFMGKPVAYSSLSEDEAEVDALQEVFKYNDEAAHNLELASEASVTGEAYELLYMDEDAKIRFCSVPSEEVILVCNASLEEEILYAIRHYRVYRLDGVTYDEFVDVYDKSDVTNYSYQSGSIRQIGGPTPHYFDDVPFVEYANNKLHRGDFEDVMSLVDAYDKAQSLTLDDMEDFTDAYLVLKGVGGTNEEDVQALRRNKVLVFEEGGGAEWLIKNLNDTYIENIKTRLQKDIHKFSSVPDMSDENFAGNASGVAIKYKLIGLEQIRSHKERWFKKGLQRRIELIGGMLKLKGVADIDFRDIEITFTANLPSNDAEQAQIVKELYGLVSQKRLLSLLPFVTDPAEEMEELQKEQQEGMTGGEASDERGILGEAEHGAGSSMAPEKPTGD